MKAILTRYLGPTNYRGSRIVATAEGGHRLTIPYPHELSGSDVHRAAAEALRDKLGWPGHLIAGALPDGSYVFVFGPGEDRDYRTCAYCGAPMSVMVRGHHHTENGVDVTR